MVEEVSHDRWEDDEGIPVGNSVITNSVVIASLPASHSELMWGNYSELGGTKHNGNKHNGAELNSADNNGAEYSSRWSKVSQF